MKNINTNHILAFLVMTLFTSFITEQRDIQKTAIDPFEMGKKLATLLADESVEYAVEELTDLELWSTIISTDNLLEVVYKPEGFQGDILEDDDLTYDINTPAFQTAKANAIALVQNNNSRSSNVPVVIYEDEDDPYVVLYVDTYESVVALRRSPNIEFLSLVGLMNEEQSERQRSGEGLLPGRNKQFLDGMNSINNPPSKTGGDRGGDKGGDGGSDGGSDGGDGGAGFRSGNCDDPPEDGGWFGCCDSDPTSVNLDYDAEGILRVPWHYEEMGIIEANECTAGAGIKVAMLDTGVSDSQYRLSTNGFKSGYPSRYITKLHTIGNDNNDECGHGTHMAGVIAAPKYDSAVRGVAYESNLVSIKSHKDVLLLTWFAKNNLRQALKKIRKGQSGTSGTKIVSMSFGYLTFSVMVRFELKRIKRKGILMFGAVGTSSSPELLRRIQVYPAKDKRVVGITGVYKGYPSFKKVCDRCHFGDKVEFVVPIQWGNESNDDDINTHSLQFSGNEASIAGGSSIAAATMAGVAAMIWAQPQNQNKSDEEIVDILRNASTNPGYKIPRYGHGVVDVLQATGCVQDPCADVQCPPNEQCVGGNCVQDQSAPCNSDGDCPPGMICTNGYCSWDLNCGPGLPPCPQGEQCIGGHCIPL